MHCLCEVEKVTEAYKLLVEMHDMGLKPSKSLCEMVIKSLKERGRFHDASKLLEVFQAQLS